VHFRTNAFQAEERQLDRTIARESDELLNYRKMLENPENVNVANRALALNSLFDEKSFSWTMLMKDFEGLVPAEVQLATIQPVRERDGSISIRMHVVGPREKVIELIHGLELSNSFRQPHVTAETARNDARPNQHANALTASSVEEFDIQAGYDESASGPAQPDSAAAAVRETASIAPAKSESGDVAPSQMTTAVVAPMPVHSGDTR
jgi:type IV pilus assembly protein PilN